MKMNTLRTKIVLALLCICTFALGLVGIGVGGLQPMQTTAAVAAEEHSHDGVIFDTKIQSAEDLSTDGELVSGNYYLSSDIQFDSYSSGLQIYDGAIVNLCLHGCTLNLQNFLITVRKGASLNLYDCSSGKTGKLITTSGTVMMNDGTTCIYGGNFIDESVNNYSGYAIRNYINGNLTVYDGTFTGTNYALNNFGDDNAQGGIVDIQGGTWHGMNSDAVYTSGGSAKLYLSGNPTFITDAVDGAAIYWNNATNGGTVYAHAKDNTAATFNGNVTVKAAAPAKDSAIVLEATEDQLANFTYVNSDWELVYREGNLVLADSTTPALSVTVGGTTTFYDSLSEAFAKAEEGTSETPATVKLYKDVTLSEVAVIPSGAVVILDLNGCTIDCGSNYDFYIYDSSTLEVCDNVGGGMIFGSCGDVIYNLGVFTLTSGTVRNNASIYGGNATYAISNTFEGEMIINGGTVSGESMGVYNVDSTFTINGGTVIGVNNDGIQNHGNSATLTINGGDISAMRGYTIYNWRGTLEMTGGTVSGMRGIWNYGGSFTFSGGTISIIDDGINIGHGIFNSGNGTVTMSGSAEIKALNDGDMGIYNTEGTVYVQGGTITSIGEGNIGIWNNATLTISGGTINGGIKTTVGTVADCLALGYAFYNTNNEAIVLSGQTVLTENVTVGECTEHTGGTAYCEQGAKCEKCGTEYGDADPDNHLPDETKWVSGGILNHYRHCSLCGAQIPDTFESHQPTGEYSTRYELSSYVGAYKLIYSFKCLECGTVEEYTGNLSFDEIGSNYVPLKAVATCTSPAVYTYTCECDVVDDRVSFTWEISHGEVAPDNHAHNDDDGICDNGCGYECLHENLSETGYCSDCNKQYAFSITEGETTTFYDAISEIRLVQEGTETDPATIKLYKDVEASWMFVSASYAVLDLNGKTLTLTAGISSSCIQVQNSTFILMDSSEGETGVCNMPNGGHVYLSSSNMTMKSGNLVGAGWQTILMDFSTLVQEGGCIKADQDCVYARDSSFTQNGGILKANRNFVDLTCSTYISNDGSAVREGSKTFVSRLAEMSDNSTATIKGGEYTVDELVSSAESGCTLTIEGGTFNVATASTVEVGNVAADATVAISGGTFPNGLKLSNTNKTFVQLLKEGYAYHNESGEIIVLTEGQTELTEKVTVDVCTHIFKDGVCGGCGYVCLHDKLDTSAVVDTGKCNVCGDQLAIGVACYDGNNYKCFSADTLNEAFALTEGYSVAGIHLHENLTVTESITVKGGNVNLDLYYNTITFEGACLTLDGAGLTMMNSGTLDFKIAEGADPNTYYNITLTNGSTLTWGSGTLTNDGGFGMLIEGGSRVVQNGGRIERHAYIDNGKYTLKGGYFVLPVHSHSDGSDSYTMDLEINGGTIEAGRLINTGSGLPDPLTVTITGGTFTDRRVDFYGIYSSEAINVSGGTFEQGIYSTSLPLSDLLKEGYAFYDGNGEIIVLSEGQTEITGTVTVDVCTHVYTDGVCGVCGHFCMHENLSETGYCSDCNKQYAFSITEGETTTFYDAISEIRLVQEGTETDPATIKLYKDVETTRVFVSASYAVLDLNGKTLTIAGSSSNISLSVQNSTFTLKDSSEEKTGVCSMEGEAYLLSSNMTLESGKIVTIGTYVVIELSRSTLVQEGGSIERTKGSFACVSARNSSFTQNGGTLKARGKVIELINSTYISNGGSAIYEKYGVTSGLIGCLVTMSESSTATINGGEHTVNGLVSSATSGCTLTITGGTFNATVTTVEVGNVEADATVQISGGTFPNGLKLSNTNKTFAQLLKEGYVYYDANDEIIILTEGQTEITGTVSVGECDHSSLTYTASGNVITETCNSETCSHSATATISTASTHYDYNGKAHPATVAYSDGWKGVELTVVYEGTAHDGSDYAVTGPVSVGNVTASISIGGATAETYFGVGQANPDLGDISVKLPATVYNSTNIADIVLERTNTIVPGTLTFDAGQTLVPNQTKYNWTFTPDDAVNYRVATGTVSITVILDDWVKLEIVTPPTKTVYTYGERFDATGIVVVATWLSGRTTEVEYNQLEDRFTPRNLTVETTEVSLTLSNLEEEFTVTQAITVNPKVVSDPKIELNEKSYRYTGQPIDGVVKVISDGDYWIAASEYTVEITNNINVGTATVTIVDVEGGNYVISGSTTFEIIPADQAELVIIDKPVGEICYGDEFVLSVLGGSGSGAVSWAVTEGSTFATVDNTGKVSIIGVGSVTITVTKAGDNNYKEAGSSFEIVVAKATNEWTEAPAIVGWTYGERANDPTATPKFGEVGFSNFAYRLKGTVSWTNDPPTDAGIYEMRVHVQATDNWEPLETIIEFEITKATTTADLFDFTAPANLNACDGVAKEASVVAKDDVAGVGSITIKYFKGETELSGAPTTVGTYTVKIDVAEGANYNATQDLTVGTFTFDITDETAHTGVTLVSNDNGTHDKVCSVCEKVLADNEACVYVDTVDAAYLASPATCVSGSTYYKSCGCGQKSTETFVTGALNPDNHTGTNDKLVSDNAGKHNVVWSCCGAVVTENVVCAPVSPDADCTTNETCACGYVISGNANHTLRIKLDKDDTYHVLECINDGCDHEEDAEHKYREDTKSEFLVSDATCISGKIYYKSCDCGHKSTETFVDGESDANNHAGTNDKILTNSNGSHNVVWSCCGAIVSENVACTPTLADDTCLTAEICICGYVIKAAATEHDFSGDYLSDAEGHWHVCADCSETDAKLAHVPNADDGDCTTEIVCSICNEVTTAANASHTGGTMTCTAQANCDVCGTAYGEIAPHTYTVVTYDGLMHWMKCEDCNAIDAQYAHVYSTWSDWTDNGDGSKSRTLTCACGNERKVVLQANVQGVDNLEEEAISRGADVFLKVESDQTKIDEASKEAIKGAVVCEQYLFLDITLTELTDNFLVNNMNTVLEIAISFNTQGRNGTTVVQENEDGVYGLTALSVRPTDNFVDGTYYIDTVNNVIYIYTSQCSTYAVVYNEIKIDSLDMIYNFVTSNKKFLFLLLLVIFLIALLMSVANRHSETWKDHWEKHVCYFKAYVKNRLIRANSV